MTDRSVILGSEADFARDRQNLHPKRRIVAAGNPKNRDETER